MEKDKEKLTGKDLVPPDRQRTAVALEYDPDDVAPRVTATGKGYVAEKIVQTAKEYDIPVHRDEKLADSLSELKVNEYIPKDLYQVVAEVLVYVDAMDKIKGKLADKKKGFRRTDGGSKSQTGRDNL